MELSVIYSTERFSAEVTSNDRNLLIKDAKERLASPLTDIRKLDIYVHIHIYIYFFLITYAELSAETELSRVCHSSQIDFVSLY